MARYSKDVNWNASGRQTKYPWSKWISETPDGHDLILDRGTDYHSTDAAVIQSARNYGQSNQYEVQSKKQPDGSLALRFNKVKEPSAN